MTDRTDTEVARSVADMLLAKQQLIVVAHGLYEPECDVLALIEQACQALTVLRVNAEYLGLPTALERP